MDTQHRHSSSTERKQISAIKDNPHSADKLFRSVDTSRTEEFVLAWPWACGSSLRNSMRLFIQILCQYLASVLRIFCLPPLDRLFASVIAINHVSLSICDERNPTQQQLAKSVASQAFAALTERINEIS